MGKIQEEEIRKIVSDVIGYMNLSDRSSDVTNHSECAKKTTQVYETQYGFTLNEKPEHMTHLRGNFLVCKDNPRIILRGSIDSLESQIILVQVIAEQKGLSLLVSDLEEIIGFIRKMLRDEITGEEVGPFYLQGMDAAALRDRSHHPSRYYGISHFLPKYDKGEIPAHLNRLRTMTRETEIKAYQAFKGDLGQVVRSDIIQGFNRLSSLFWIMIFKYLAGQYEEEK